MQHTRALNVELLASCGSFILYMHINIVEQTGPSLVGTFVPCSQSAPAPNVRHPFLIPPRAMGCTPLQSDAAQANQLRQSGLTDCFTRRHTCCAACEPQIEPREVEINEMRETIRAMDAELERYHKSNSGLDLTIQVCLLPCRL